MTTVFAPALAAVVALLLPVLAPAQAAARQPAPTVPLVRFPFPPGDDGLTPYTFEVGYPLVALVYDTLLWRDADGVPQPWLARSIERDGRILTIRLADGARWHDGEPVTSADVAFTLEFVRQRHHPRFTPQVEAVDRVATPDDRTIVVSLRHAAPGFVDQPLADLPILPAHLWRDLPRSRLAPDGAPVGSGPYRVVEHRPGERFRLEAVADHFRGSPAVAALEVPVMERASDMLEALERREVDMVPLRLPDEAAEDVRRFGIELVEGPSYVGTVLVFNTRVPPFDDVAVRRAAASALDVNRLARAVRGAVPADRGFIHPASPWSAQEPIVRLPRGEPGALAGLGGAVPLLAPDNDPVKQAAARRVVTALERAGIAARLAVVPAEDLSRALGEDGSRPSFQAAISSSPALVSYDPDFLGRLFGTTPALNATGYRSEALAAAVAEVSTAADERTRRAGVDAAVRVLARDVPAVPLFFSPGIFAYRPTTFDGWVFVKGTGILDKRSFLEPARRIGRTTKTPPGDDDARGTSRAVLWWPVAVLAVGLTGLAAALLVAPRLPRRRTRR